ncbi:hypothetical protein KPA07_06250 [Corynebacterium aurimucosum]|uniref:hypothetical protein n=1 Tax=Corynebacterium aurimucosum TaxID=169292 RepID=UPI001C0F00DB|nr:hypothetical protein [Corynebacterium aurimucosum]MBU5654513.1 hypothetical protein [Corynebacterium aurimucosum]
MTTIDYRDYVCQECAQTVTHGLNHTVDFYIHDMELVAAVDRAIEAMPASTRVDYESTAANTVNSLGVATFPCAVCGDATPGERYALTVDRVEVELPDAFVRVPREWIRDARGKAIGPMCQDGLGDVVIAAADLEAVIPMATGWITPGKYATYTDRFNDAAGRTTDRAAARMALFDCTVTVEEWIAGKRPQLGATTPPEELELPGARHAAKRAKLPQTSGADSSEVVSVLVRGVRGVEDCELVAALSKFEHHVSVTCGWLRMDAGRNTWHSQLNATGGKKFARAVKKLIATGEFETRALATV